PLDSVCFIDFAPAPAPFTVGLLPGNDHEEENQRRNYCGPDNPGGEVRPVDQTIHRDQRADDDHGRAKCHQPALPGRWRRTIAISLGPEPISSHGHQPTLPSSEIEISFCASTANSIGSCCSTSRTKPLTTRAVASSADMPRCWQ